MHYHYESADATQILLAFYQNLRINIKYFHQIKIKSFVGKTVHLTFGFKHKYARTERNSNESTLDFSSIKIKRK